jgi:hypothetical protein
VLQSCCHVLGIGMGIFIQDVCPCPSHIIDTTGPWHTVLVYVPSLPRRFTGSSDLGLKRRHSWERSYLYQAIDTAWVMG